MVKLPKCTSSSRKFSLQIKQGPITDKLFWIIKGVSDECLREAILSTQSPLKHSQWWRLQWVDRFTGTIVWDAFILLSFQQYLIWGIHAALHDDVMKWKHFPRYWPFVRGIHRSPVNSPHKGQWRGALIFSLISVWINGWVNNREAGDWRHHRAHYDVIVMKSFTQPRLV